MPNANWGLYLTGGDEGDEISSTYEGRHVTCTAAELITDGGSGVAVKGHACVFGLLGLQAVGVCFNSGTLTDLIAIDTEGIWNLPVDGDDDDGVSILRPGSPVYINTATCVISGIRNNATQIPFGYLLTQVASAGNDVISAVKVHWDPRSHWLLDNEMLYFGDGTGVAGTPGDVSIEWTGANLEMLPLANDTGAFLIGNGILSMDVQIYGMNAATSMLYDSSVGTLHLVNTVLPTGDSCLSIRATLTDGASDGIAAYWDGVVAGTPTGDCYAAGSWLEIAAGAVIANRELRGFDVGVYDAGAAASGGTAIIYGICISTYVAAVTDPNVHAMMRFNTNAAWDVPDYWFFAANQQAIAFAGGAAEPADKIGSITVYIQGIGVRYLRLYLAA